MRGFISVFALHGLRVFTLSLMQGRELLMLSCQGNMVRYVVATYVGVKRWGYRSRIRLPLLLEADVSLLLDYRTSIIHTWVCFVGM